MYGEIKPIERIKTIIPLNVFFLFIKINKKLKEKNNDEFTS